VQDRRIEIVDMNRLVSDVVAKVVSFAIHNARANSPRSPAYRRACHVA
jgi:hypothetical protein